MANDTNLTWAKAHSYWLASTDYLYSSIEARYLYQVISIIARESSSGGALLVGDKPMTSRDIAHRANMTPEEVESALQELENINWVSREGGVISLVNYVKEQVLNGDDLSITKSRDYGRIRKRRFDDKETNRDRVVKSNGLQILNALNDLGYINQNGMTQFFADTNKKSASKAVTDLKKFLDENKETDQDFLSVCYDMGYIPLDDGDAFDKVWNHINKNQDSEPVVKVEKYQEKPQEKKQPLPEKGGIKTKKSENTFDDEIRRQMEEYKKAPAKLKKMAFQDFKNYLMMSDHWFEFVFYKPDPESGLAEIFSSQFAGTVGDWLSQHETTWQLNPEYPGGWIVRMFDEMEDIKANPQKYKKKVTTEEEKKSDIPEEEKFEPWPW